MQESVKGVASEMRLYERTKKKTENLERLYNALLNVSPTSVSSERAFSISGAFVVNRRASLKHSTLDDLCFLKCFYDSK